MITIGSLCSGYGGLDMGVQLVYPQAHVAWHVEYDPMPSKILDHHWPNVPNHGDVKHTDWAAVEPIEVLTAGYPCQPFSHAGLRKGADDPRHLWPGVARAISVLRPRLAVLENVRGHVSLGLDAVLGDLADLGYDATWGVVRAADAGAPHSRARVFILATDARDGACDGERTRSESGQRGAATPDAGRGSLPGTAPAGYGLRVAPERGDSPAADTGRADGRGADPARSGLDRLHVPEGGRNEGAGAPLRRRAAPVADATSDRRDEGWTEPAGLLGGPDAALSRRAATPDTDSDGRARLTGLPAERGAVHSDSGRDADRCGPVVEWGAYAPAVARWEAVTGRLAPRPTERGRTGERLSPRFVEWMMGLPEGHVTDVPGLARNAQLKALGNGVVPQQAALAVQTLLPLAVAA